MSLLEENGKFGLFYTMTDTVGTVIAAVVVASPPTAMAYLSWKSSRENSKKADTLVEKTEQIHTLANSQLTTVTASLEAANKKIDGLEKLVATFVKKRSRS